MTFKQLQAKRKMEKMKGKLKEKTMKKKITSGKISDKELMLENKKLKLQKKLIAENIQLKEEIKELISPSKKSIFKNRNLIKENEMEAEIYELDENTLAKYYTELDPKGETTLEELTDVLSDYNGRIGYSVYVEDVVEADELLGNHGMESETLYKSDGEDVTFVYSNTGSMDAMTLIIAPNEEVYIGTYSDARKAFETPKEEFKAEYSNMRYHTYVEDEDDETGEEGAEYTVVYDEETDTMYMGGATNSGVFREYEIDVDYDNDLDFNLQGLIEEYQSSKY